MTNAGAESDHDTNAEAKPPITQMRGPSLALTQT